MQTRENTGLDSYEAANFYAGYKRVEHILLHYVKFHIATAVLLGLLHDICSPS
jgi:hypothetical protein